MQPTAPSNESISVREQVEIARGPFSIRGTLTRPGRPPGVIVRAAPLPSLEGAGLLEMAQREGFGLLEIHAPPRSDCPPSADPALEEHEIHRHVQALLAAIDWLGTSPLRHAPVGILASGSLATSALHAAAARPASVKALVLCEPSLDLAAADLLARVSAPVLSLVRAENVACLVPLLEHLRAVHHEEVVVRASLDADQLDNCEPVAAWFRRWFARN